jgi:hypothetical protein
MSTDRGAAAARGGLRAVGVQPFAADSLSALRDCAAGLLDEPPVVAADAATGDGAAPRTIEDLMTSLTRADRRISVQRIGAGRYIVYLPGGRADEGARLRLVCGDNASYVRQVVRAIEDAVEGEPGARVMLVGSSHGGTAAAEIAAAAVSDAFVVDQVITTGAPSAQVPTIPEQTRVLSLEDRSDPVALLGSLINTHVGNRLTVVYDGRDEATPYVVGGRAADAAQHPEVRAEIARIHELGFLAG